jgi:hypothetical protein
VVIFKNEFFTTSSPAEAFIGSRSAVAFSGKAIIVKPLHVKTH